MSAELLPLILNAGTAILSVSAAGFFVAGVANIKQRQQKSARGLQGFLFGKLNIEGPSEPTIRTLRPRRLIEDAVLTQTAADIGVADLEVLLRSFISAAHKPPHLFGINKGGSLVANHIAHRLNLHEKYLVKCDFRPEFEKMYCEEREQDQVDNIFILDDVVRTGKTINFVKRALIQKYPSSRIYTICLVYVANNENEFDLSAVDYCAWLATSKHIKMPWSSRSDTDVAPAFKDIAISQMVGNIQNSQPSDSENQPKK